MGGGGIPTDQDAKTINYGLSTLADLRRPTSFAHTLNPGFCWFSVFLPRSVQQRSQAHDRVGLPQAQAISRNK